MRALPISGLKPQCLASIGGLIDVPKDPFGALEGLIGSYGPLENLAVNS
jgi:hypothetical protein